MKFGENLGKRRQAVGLTREELAGAVETTHQSIWRWEKGISHPDTVMVSKLAKALGCTVGYLFGEAETKDEPNVRATLEAIRVLMKRGELTLEDIVQAAMTPKRKR